MFSDSIAWREANASALFFYNERDAWLYSDAGGFQLLDESSNLPIEVEGGRVSFKLWVVSPQAWKWKYLLH